MTSIGATERIWFAAGERYPIYRGSFCKTSIGATDRIWFAAGERYPIYRGSFCMTSIGATDRIWFGKGEQYPIYGLSSLHQYIYFRKDFQRCTLTVGCSVHFEE